MLFSRGKFGKEGDKDSFTKGYMKVAESNAKLMIIKRSCLDCDKDHEEIYYKRKTMLKTFNIYDTFIQQWSEQDNKYGTDFLMYSTLTDALQDRNEWKFCNFDWRGGNVGFPRDCGPEREASMQWNTWKADDTAGYGSREHYKFEIVAIDDLHFVTDKNFEDFMQESFTEKNPIHYELE